jgi:hypothetical protein
MLWLCSAGFTLQHLLRSIGFAALASQHWLRSIGFSLQYKPSQKKFAKTQAEDACVCSAQGTWLQSDLGWNYLFFVTQGMGTQLQHDPGWGHLATG